MLSYMRLSIAMLMQSIVHSLPPIFRLRFPRIPFKLEKAISRKHMYVAFSLNTKTWFILNPYIKWRAKIYKFKNLNLKRILGNLNPQFSCPKAITLSNLLKKFANSSLFQVSIRINELASIFTRIYNVVVLNRDFW